MAVSNRTVTATVRTVQVTANARATGPKGVPGADGASLVTSVAGRQGDVTLSKADVGLGLVDNTSDASKPVSTAQQTALDGKVDKQSSANALSVYTFDGAGNQSFRQASSSVLTSGVAVLRASGGQITGVTPSNNTDLANKLYVDTAVATREAVLAAGAISQYYRGDKTWQSLDQNALVASNSPSATTFYRGDGSWVVPTNTTYSSMTLAEYQAGTGTTSRIITPQNLKGAINYHATTQTYVDTADALKANIASPTLTGTPSAPTATAGTNTTQIATTAFVTNGLSGVTRETINQNTTLKSFGDSITAGVGSSGPAFYYPKLIGDAKGWTVTNLGVSGARVYDPAIIDNAYAEVVDASKNYTLMIGVNNAGANATGVSYLDTFRGCLMAVCAWLTIPDGYKVRAGSTTRTGTWEVNTGVYGSMGQRSQTNGSTMSTTVVGTTVYIGHIKNPPENGTFRVTIDGNDYGIFYTTGSVNTRQGDVSSYAAYCLRFPGLKTGPHEVVITVTSATGASNGVYITWIGGNGFKKEINGPNLWLGNPTRATDAYYAVNTLSEASISLYGAAVLEVANSLAADDLSITFVDVASSINRTTDMNADGLHPSDAGMAKIAEAFVSSMSSLSKTRDRGGALRKNTPWFEPVLTNSWVVFDAPGTGYFSPAYMKDALGFVHLRGIAKSGTIGTSMFTLPLGFRPAATFHQICDTGGLNVKGVIEIGVDGNVIAATGANTYMCMDSLIFEAGL